MKRRDDHPPVCLMCGARVEGQKHGWSGLCDDCWNVYMRNPHSPEVN